MLLTSFLMKARPQLIGRILNDLNVCIPKAQTLILKRDSSEMGFVKTSMSQLTPDEGYHLQITGFNEFGFSINQNIKALGPVVVFPKTLFSWNVSGPEEINEKSLLLFTMLNPRLDILIIGTGDKYSKINPEIPKWLIKNKITNFEILNTDKAINAFNFLIAEDRFVAAALMPAFVKREPDYDTRKIMERAELYREVGEDKNAESFQKIGKENAAKKESNLKQLKEEK